MGKAQIQKGSQGNDVKEWQNYLIGKGYVLGKSGADGIFGDMTYAATRKYQQDMGLDVDGIVGVNTWGSMSSGGNSSSGNDKKSDNEFTYSPFTTSEETNAAKANLDGLTTPDALDPSYWAYVMAAQDKINNREKFSYDLNGDALYQQYKDKYIQQGKMAMQDTMGQAAALTGGYGNSYASTAGNQAYQAHLENLNDVVPELWQMAYDRYNQEGQDLINQYAMAKDNYTTKYGEWSDQMAQYNTDRSYLQAVYDSMYGRDYDAWNDNRTFEYGQHRDEITDEQWQAAMEYQKERDEITDRQWEQEYRSKYGDDAVQYAPTGNTGGDGNTGGNGGEDGNTGGKYYNNSGYGEDFVKQAQEFVGVTADGMWGDQSAAAAKAKGYNSLAEVIKAAGIGQFKPVESKAVTNFQASVRTRNEFYGRPSAEKEKYKTYEAYLEGKIKAATWLTDDEVATLIAYYGLDK